MEQPAQSLPTPASANFAGLLAALASAPPEKATPAKAWSDSDLGEDVVTLSYEHALRAHARYIPADKNDWRLKRDRPTEAETARDSADSAAAGLNRNLSSHASQETGAENPGDLRSASVTIRLSKAECARLHEHAAEAGVTVSAYLRSCTFEAEALRAQVKEALAGMRSIAEQGIEGSGTQGGGAVHQRADGEVRLRRVLVHIGKLCLGISIGKRA